MKFLALAGALVGAGVKQGKFPFRSYVLFSNRASDIPYTYVTTHTVRCDKVHIGSVQDTLQKLRERLSEQKGYTFVSASQKIEGPIVTYTIVERWASLEREQEIKRLKNVFRNYSALHFLGSSVVVGENKNI